MKSGIATIPLDYGKCPAWLFKRMKRLLRNIVLVIVEEFGPEEFLKRLSDPVWFQSLGCIVAFDWNSSGLTTTLMGALKEAIRGIEPKIGFFICGGKGKTSRKTPEQIREWGECLGFSTNYIEQLVYTSKITAKVDSALIQDGFQIYHHNLLFTESGQWSVIQQGMNTEFKKARRYHWFSSGVKEFLEEPHSGIISDIKLKPLNLISIKSRENKKICTELAREEPKTFLRDISIISQKSNSLIRQRRIPGFTQMELSDIEFHWHPVIKEKFDLKRLKKIVGKIHSFKPNDFEELLAIEGVGPRTIRALSLVSEIIYGAKPSYEDPARYSFSFGGKDGTPYFPNQKEMDMAIEILERAIQKSKIPHSEKVEIQRNLIKMKYE